MGTGATGMGNPNSHIADISTSRHAHSNGRGRFSRWPSTGGSDQMGKRTYKGMMLVLAFLALMLDKALMVAEVRHSLNVDPRHAVGLGVVAAMAAIVAASMAVRDE